MTKHLRYLSYVLRHKWWVLVAGLHLRVPLRLLLIHDLSKFSRAEWGPYVNVFGVRPRPAHTPESDAAFKKAWDHHWRNNPHHPQYWSGLFSKYAPQSPVEMPDYYAREMVADWYGAGRAQHGRGYTWDNTWEWFSKIPRSHFHPNTYSYVETILLAA